MQPTPTDAPPRPPARATLPDRVRARGAGITPRLGNRALMGATTLLLGVLVFLPLLFVLLGAVSEDVQNPLASFTTEALGDSYGSPEMLTVLGQTLLMALTCGVGGATVGGGLAWVLARVRLPLSKALELTVMSPLFLSPFVGALAWVALAAPRSGILNQLAADAGLPSWVHLNVLSVTGMILILTLYYVPYGYLFVSGTLRNMDASLEEASYINGRGVVQTALRVTFPLVRSSMISVVLFISILASGMFSVPSILGVRSDFSPLAVQVFRVTKSFPADYALAASIGTMLILVSVAALYLYQRSLRHTARFVTVTGKARRADLISPGPWKYPLLALFVLYGLGAVVLPYAALILTAVTPFAVRDLSRIQFTFDNIQEVLAADALRTAFANTAVVAVATSVACIAIGLLTVHVTERIRLKGSGIVNSLAMAPLAVPGIVFGTGVLWLYVRTPLYATIAVIIIAYTANYLPHAVRITGNGLTQIDPALEEASAVCGASRLRTTGRIIAPLLKPSIFSAGVLVFIFTVREINTAVMLYSPNTILASVLSFNYTEQGSLSSAAVVGLLQTLLMLAVILGARWLLGVRTSRSQL